MRAVRFDEYGGVDVLEVRDVEDPVAGPGQVLVAVTAAGINPGEIAIREGWLHQRWPATFPSGEGTDLAGVVRAVGEGVSAFAIGDQVLGWTEERASHAELVAVPADQLTAKPDSVPWEVAGSLFVAGMAAYASVQAVAPQPGETVVVSAAAGGVGSVAVQLARRTGATVIGLAGERNHDWLRDHEILPVTYGEGQSERIRAAAHGRSTRSSTPLAAVTSTWRLDWVSHRSGSTRSSTTRPLAGSAYTGKVPTRSPPRHCSLSSPTWWRTAASRFRSRAPSRSSRSATPSPSSQHATPHGKIVLRVN